MNITLLVSGELGLRCLDWLFGRHHTVSFVFTDSRSDKIIALCQACNIAHFVGNPRGGRAAAVLAQSRCDVLLSINYLFIVEQDIIDLARLYAINFHGSLLPKYRGRTPHVWAIICGETTAGVSAHLMTLRMDAGDLVGQRVIHIDTAMTGANVLQQYTKVYPELIDELLDRIATDSLVPTPQREELATYFPKRRPEDGAILWTWSRERVRNWIRAQAAPYPGAYFTFREQRVTVHWSIFDETGFYHSDPDGTVLKKGQDHVVVKLANGALRVGPIAQDVLIQIDPGTQLR